MSELIVIGYDQPDSATQAYEQVLSLQNEHVVDLRGLAIVTVDAQGKSHVDTAQRIVGTSAMSGALWGLLIGVLFFVPGLGVVGGLLGVLFWQAEPVRDRRALPVEGSGHAQNQVAPRS